MVKVQKNIVISPESQDMIERQGSSFNLSAWIDEQIKSNLLDVDDLKAKQSKLEKEIEKVKSDIEILKEFDKQKKVAERAKFKSLSLDEIQFLDETIEVIKKNPSYIEGRRKALNNRFEQNFNRVDFLRYIDEYKKSRGIKK